MLIYKIPMTKKKTIIIQDIQNNFQQSKAVIFYNFHQVENEQIFQLKKELKKTESLWKIYKNTLVKKALPTYSLELQKANAFIFCQADEYKPLTVLSQFNKEYSTIERFQGGIYNQRFVDKVLLEKWADLPSKEILISNLCYYLHWNLRKLVKVFEKILTATEQPLVETSSQEKVKK